MPAKKKLNTGTSIEENEIEEIDERLAQISSKRDDLNEEAAKLVERKNVLEATSGIAARVATMTRAEQDSLFQELRAQGIGSGEALGTPGT